MSLKINKLGVTVVWLMNVLDKVIRKIPLMNKNKISSKVRPKPWGGLISIFKGIREILQHFSTVVFPIFRSISLKRLPFFTTSLIIVFFSIQIHLPAQPVELPFKAGEKLTYKAAYNWHFVWVEAGKAEFLVDSLKYDERGAYHFKSFGRTLSSYDWFFKVRDNFESVADAETLMPYWFKRNTSEGGYKATEKYNFDYLNKQIITQVENSNKPLTKSFIPLDVGVMDVQTAVYYARSLDFSRMKTDEKIPFSLMFDGLVYDIFGRYLGIEQVENFDGVNYRCHKFSVLLVEGTIFSGGEDLFVWVTDDRNKIPILVEAKILVGAVKAYFVKAENLKFPMEAVIMGSQP